MPQETDPVMSKAPRPTGDQPSVPVTRTPGPLGHKDAASPDSPRWFRGDTPGTLGRRDGADPDFTAETGARLSSSGRWILLADVSGGSLGLLPGGDYNAAIQINGDAQWIARIRAYLGEVAGTKVGSALLADLASTGRRVRIVKTAENSKTSTAPNFHNPDAIPRGKYWEDWKDSFGKPLVPEGTGKGSDSVIEFNPDQKLPDEEAFRGMPTAVMLAHELIHADLYARGTYDPEQVDQVRNGERQVIGLRPFEAGIFTENKIRSEWKPKLTSRSRH